MELLRLRDTRATGRRHSFLQYGLLYFSFLSCLIRCDYDPHLSLLVAGEMRRYAIGNISRNRLLHRDEVKRIQVPATLITVCAEDVVKVFTPLFAPVGKSFCFESTKPWGR